MKIEVFVDGEEGVAMLTDQSLLWAARTGNASFEACYKDVQQILVSKKLPTNVKLVLEGSSNPGTFMLRFLNKTDAAAAVDAMSGRGVAPPPPQPSLSDLKSGSAAPTHSSAVLHHICASLVEDGVVEQELVDEANAKFRGVLHVFEAINELVDARLYGDGVHGCLTDLVYRPLRVENDRVVVGINAATEELELEDARKEECVS